MKKTLLTCVFVGVGLLLSAAHTFAEEAKTATPETPAAAEDAEAKYTKTIEGRTTDILKVLALTNSVAVTNVHDIIIAQWRGLRTWHDANDAKLKEASKTDTNKAAEIKATLKTLHDEFITKLSAELTPAQVDTVKDKMTYGIVQVTYHAYQEKYPGLTDNEKKQILAWLIEARESAMDAGSSDEKHAVFGKFKGRINNYLSKAGYDSKTGLKKSSEVSTNQPTK